jgi:hypothetical protein
MTTAARREHTALTEGRGNAVQACYTGRLQLGDDGGKICRSLVGARLANLASRAASGGRETAASEATKLCHGRRVMRLRRHDMSYFDAAMHNPPICKGAPLLLASHRLEAILPIGSALARAAPSRGEHSAPNVIVAPNYWAACEDFGVRHFTF